MAPRKKRWPETLNGAVERLLAEMAPKDLDALREMSEGDLFGLHFGLGMYIRNHFGLNQGNDELLESVAPHSFIHDPDSASSKIIEALWTRLRSKDEGSR